MKLRFKAFKCCADVLKFVIIENIDADNIISISATFDGHQRYHFLWWKEEEINDS